jgi:hypothetical protein
VDEIGSCGRDSYGCRVSEQLIINSTKRQKVSNTRRAGIVQTSAFGLEQLGF